MKIIKDFKLEILLFIFFIIVQFIYFQLSIIFQQLLLMEIIYLLVLEMIVFLFYLLYKEWLYCHQMDRCLHQKVKKRIDQLIHDHKLMNEKYREAQATTEEVNDIVYGYIHELKTPIAAIKLGDPPAFIEKEVFRLEEIIQKLLYMTRITDIKNDLILTNYSMDSLVKNVIKKYQTIFIQKKISLIIAFDDFDLMTDQKWFEFALAQFISNALKYTDASGHIVITTDDRLHQKHLIIEDNGCGIPKGYINRIFEKGFSFDQQNRNYKGTGIGLYLSKKIFDYLAIECKVESIESKGTKVTLLMNNTNDFYNLT